MAKSHTVVCIAILVSGCSGEGAQSHAPTELAPEYEQLDGDWVAIARDIKGAWPGYEEEHATYKLSFDGTRVTEITAATTKQATVVLDITKRPNEITFEYPPHFASWGTYVLKDEKLIISWALGKSTEPTESENATFIFQRVTK